MTDKCDNPNGPCACGAWHEVGSRIGGLTKRECFAAMESFVVRIRELEAKNERPTCEYHVDYGGPIDRKIDLLNDRIRELEAENERLKAEVKNSTHQT